MFDHFVGLVLKGLFFIQLCKLHPLEMIAFHCLVMHFLKSLKLETNNVNHESSLGKDGCYIDSKLSEKF